MKGRIFLKLCFSWDDGALEDQKLFELHNKYKIPGMFFVPSKNREGLEVLTPSMIRSAESNYVTFGGHTENHTYLTEVPLAKAEEEVALNKSYLENVLGHQIEHFCLPGGHYNADVLNMVYKHYRTIRTADTMNFYYNGGPLKPTIHFYPRGKKSLLGNAIRNKSYRQAMLVLTHFSMDYFQLATYLAKSQIYDSNSVVMIWGHSWELEKYQLWSQLENLMALDFVRETSVRYEKMFELRKDI